jgi:sulfonate transport system ATP-binding protein
MSSVQSPVRAHSESLPLPVSLRGVGRVFAAQRGGTERRVLRDITLDIAPGEIVALLGPSGCGKSTLLRQISGLDRPSVGTLTINRENIAPADQRCAVAFQEPRLLPWRSVTRNVALGLPRGLQRAQGAQRVSELLELVQLSDAALLKPREISGGMAQRVSLARALARGPGVLLLDEPFGALDALTRLTMQDLLVDIHLAKPATIVLVTHDVDEALALADRIVLLGTRHDRPGATISMILDVPGSRPRDRASTTLARLRSQLLDQLGVPSHHGREPRRASSPVL